MAACSVARRGRRRVAAQPARFEDVVRNLRNPDPKARLARCGCCGKRSIPKRSSRSRRWSTIPLDPIQLEAIAAELSFFLVQDLPERRRLGSWSKSATAATAAEAFELGPLAVWPRPAPPELIDRSPQGRRRREPSRPAGSDLRGGDDRERPVVARRRAAADQGARSLRPGRPGRRGALRRPGRREGRRRRAGQAGQRLERRGAVCRRCGRSGCCATSGWPPRWSTS